MYHHRRNTTKRSIFHNAGWLFADLLLALTIIFIAASVTGKPVAKASLPATPTPTPTPTPFPTVVPQGLDPHSLTFTIFVDPALLSQSATITQVQNQVSQHIDQAQRSNQNVGIVLTFGGDFNGVKNATRFNDILRPMPGFGNAVFKNYHDLNNAAQEFDLEIFFFIG